MQGAQFDLPGVFGCSPALVAHNLNQLYPVPFAMPLLEWPKAELSQNKVQEPPGHLLPALSSSLWGSTAAATAVGGGGVPRAMLQG